MKKGIKEIGLSATQELATLVSEFGDAVEQGTADTNKVMTFDEIEKQMSQLRHETEQVYTNMLGEIISSVDELSLIRKKKESCVNKG